MRREGIEGEDVRSRTGVIPEASSELIMLSQYALCSRLCRREVTMLCI